MTQASFLPIPQVFFFTSPQKNDTRILLANFSGFFLYPPPPPPRMTHASYLPISQVFFFTPPHRMTHASSLPISQVFLFTYPTPPPNRMTHASSLPISQVFFSIPPPPVGWHTHPSCQFLRYFSLPPPPPPPGRMTHASSWPSLRWAIYWRRYRNSSNSSLTCQTRLPWSPRYPSLSPRFVSNLHHRLISRLVRTYKLLSKTS